MPPILPAMLFAFAAGPGLAAMPADAVVAGDAQEYGRELAELVSKIEDQYVRPVVREAALAAAVAGLHEQGRLPLPARLVGLAGLVELKSLRPVTRESVLRAALNGLYEEARLPLPAGLSEQLARLPTGDTAAFLARHRARVGNGEAVRGPRALVASARALPRALDPFCGVVTAAEQAADEGAGWGLGLTLERTEALLAWRLGQTGPAPPVPEPLRIKTVSPGSPAQKAGLRPGDVLSRIGGQPAAAVNRAAFAEWIDPNRTEGQRFTVHLDVARPGETALRSTEVTADGFETETVTGWQRFPDGRWNYLADPVNKLGYVRLGYIGLAAPQDLYAAVASLARQGCRGVVLDVRDCPGGYLSPAVAVARLWLPPDVKEVARTRYRDAGVQPATTEEQLAGHFPHLPLVVLTGHATQGGGEIVSAVLQDFGRATVVGQRTVGKASVQQALKDTPRLSFKISVGELLRPSGKNFQKLPGSGPHDDWGVRPDRDLPVTPELAATLRQWWQWQTLRPAASRESLPLDDPLADPQWAGAVRALREKVR